jgi:Zn-dependent peptidase ImmA (M78 family)
MGTKTSWINPQMLRWAREQVGLTPDDVGKLSQNLGGYAAIDPHQLAQWEAGEAEPELEHLETLSELYVCPVGYFFLSAPPQEQQALSFRGLAREKQDRLSPLSRQTLRRFLALAEWTVSVIEEANIEWPVKVQFTSKRISLKELVVKERERFLFTPKIRTQWQTPEEAFRWWRERIESLGVFCFQMPLDPHDIRGASLWVQHRYPFILVNHHDVEAATGRLFTLLHEYAHLLTHRHGLICDFRGTESNLESFANQFAARMLLSHDELKERLTELGQNHPRETWSDQILDDLRQPFFISRDVVAIILQELHLAPDNFYQRKREQWERRQPFGRGKGGRPLKVEQKRRELGSSLTNLLARAYKQRAISPIDVADIVGVTVEKVEQFIGTASEPGE